MSFAKYPVSGGAGSSTVTGPATSTNNGVVLFNGTTGNVVKDLGVGAANEVLVTDGTTPSFSLIGTANIASPNQLITNVAQTIDGNKQFTGATQLGPTPAFTGNLRQVINTGLQGATAVFNASEAGRIQFANVTGSATNPCIIGTSNSTGGSGFGLGIYALTNDGNTIGDMVFDARENDSTVHATTTNLAFSFRYLNTPYLRVRRDSLTTLGSDTFTGTHVINGGFSATQPVTLSAASNQIVLSSGTNQLTLNSGTSGAARTYDIPNVGATGTFMMLEGLQTVAGTKIFSQPITIQQAGNQLVLGSSTTTTINATTPAANRIYTIPDAGAAADFVMTAGTQSNIGGAKTFTSALTLNAASNQLVMSSGTNQLTLNSGTSASTRIYTVPDVGGTAQFVMTAGTQNSIGGAKTFTSLLTTSAGLTVSGGSAADLSIWSASNVLNLRGGTSGLDIYNTSGVVTVDVTNAGAVTLGPPVVAATDGVAHFVRTGDQGTTLNISSTNAGTIQFANAAVSAASPLIAGTTNDTGNAHGLFIGAFTNDGTTGGDMCFDVRENDNTDFTTTANNAFVWRRFGNVIMSTTRAGSITLGPSAGGVDHHVWLGESGATGPRVLYVKSAAALGNGGSNQIIINDGTTNDYLSMGVYKHSGVSQGCGFLNIKASGTSRYFYTDTSGNLRYSGTVTDIGTSGGTFIGGPSSSGRYTPTVTNGTNVTVSTAASSHYSRVGDQVIVSVGVGSVTTTSASNTASALYVTLPIASNFTSTSDLYGGGGIHRATATLGSTGVICYADVTNDRAEIRWCSQTTGASDLIVTFQYEIK